MLAVILFALLISWRPEVSSISALCTERFGLVSIAICIAAIWKIRAPIIFRVCAGYFACSALISVFFGGSTTIPNRLAHEQLEILFTFATFLWCGVSLKRLLNLSALVLGVLICLSPHPSIEVYSMHNPSTAATFVVLASWCHPVSLIAILFAKSWTAAGALVVGLSFRYGRTLVKFKGVVMSALFVVFLSCAGKSIPFNGRLETWHKVLALYISMPMHGLLFGAGSGSTAYWLPVASLSSIGTQLVTPWAHNDWLQLLFESGAVGLCLTLATAAKMFRMLDNDDRPTFLAFCIAMCSNFPLHIALTVLVLWELTRRSLANSVINKEHNLSG